MWVRRYYRASRCTHRSRPRPALRHHRPRAPRRVMPMRRLDAESQAWLVRLRGVGPVRDRAIAELHERLRREAWFHLRVRTSGMSEFPRSDLDDLAVQAAGDALLAVLRKLDDYRGESQFWIWARRFAQLEAPVSIRRRLGHDRLANDPEHAFALPDPGCSPQERAEIQELLRTVSDLIVEQLTTRQRAVLIASRDRRRLDRDARDRARHHPRGDLQDAARRPQETDRATRRCAERASRIAGHASRRFRSHPRSMRVRTGPRETLERNGYHVRSRRAADRGGQSDGPEKIRPGRSGSVARDEGVRYGREHR